MKEDEKRLLGEILGGASPRDAALHLGISAGRIRYLFTQKWPQKGWYDYGVTHDVGWLTEEGREAARKLQGER